MKITNPENLASGALVSAIALFFLFAGRDLPLAGMSHMGPGLLPMLVALSLLALGVVLLASSVITARDAPLRLPHWRPWLCVGLAPLVFSGLIDQFGLAISVAVTALVARLGVRHRFGWELVLMPLVLSAGIVMLFVYILNMPIDPWMPQ